MTVIGNAFYVNAKFSEKYGWSVHSAICREGDDLLKILPKDMHQPKMVGEKKTALRTPMRSKYIVPIIRDMVSKNPGLCSQYIKDVMKPYAKEYALTNSLVQEARDVAKAVLFGKTEDNVKFHMWGCSSTTPIGSQS